MNKSPVLLALWLLLTAVSCRDEDGRCIRATGSITTETRAVDEFLSVSAGIVGNLHITQGSPQEVKITTHSGLMSRVETNVINGKLEIGMKGCMRGDIDQFDVNTPSEEIGSHNKQT